MNERIKELAEQAEKLKRDEVSYRERLHNRYLTGDMEEEVFREKFAELIVKECAEVAGCNSHVSGFTLGDLIKQHFGVEE